MYENDVAIADRRIRVGILGSEDAREYGLSNWSIKPIQSQRDVQRRRPLARGLCESFEQFKVERAYAPQVTHMRAGIVDATVLRECISLGRNIRLYRKHNLSVEGVFLEPGAAFVSTSAESAVIIATAGEHLIITHAGRDSLVDRGAVLGKPARTHVSVVQHIIAEFRKKGIPPEHIAMCLLFAPPLEALEHRFDHRKYGAYNRALGDFVDAHWKGCTFRPSAASVCLDLESLFIEQAKEAGVRRNWSTLQQSNIDLRHSRHQPRCRNLVIVKRNQ